MTKIISVYQEDLHNSSIAHVIFPESIMLEKWFLSSKQLPDEIPLTIDQFRCYVILEKSSKSVYIKCSRGPQVPHRCSKLWNIPFRTTHRI